MRTLLPAAVLVASFLLAGVAHSADRVKPKVAITKTVKKKQGKKILFDFYIKATDNDEVRSVMVRAAVDGKQGPWRRYPYYSYPGQPYHLPFLVDCHTFVFEVCSIDKSRNKSKIRKRTYTGLR